MLILIWVLAAALAILGKTVDHFVRKMVRFLLSGYTFSLATFD